jgi:hypothetical protein
MGRSEPRSPIKSTFSRSFSNPSSFFRRKRDLPQPSPTAHQPSNRTCLPSSPSTDRSRPSDTPLSLVNTNTPCHSSASTFDLTERRVQEQHGKPCRYPLVQSRWRQEAQKLDGMQRACLLGAECLSIKDWEGSEIGQLQGTQSFRRRAALADGQKMVYISLHLTGPVASHMSEYQYQAYQGLQSTGLGSPDTDVNNHLQRFRPRPQIRPFSLALVARTPEFRSLRHRWITWQRPGRLLPYSNSKKTSHVHAYGLPHTTASSRPRHPRSGLSPTYLPNSLRSLTLRLIQPRLIILALHMYPAVFVATSTHLVMYMSLAIVFPQPHPARARHPHCWPSLSVSWSSLSHLRLRLPPQLGQTQAITI